MLLAVPNVSEGRDAAALDAIGAAFAAAGARVLDRHADPDHHRAVFTLAGPPGGQRAVEEDRQPQLCLLYTSPSPRDS